MRNFLALNNNLIYDIAFSVVVSVSLIDCFRVIFGRSADVLGMQISNVIICKNATMKQFSIKVRATLKRNIMYYVKAIRGFMLTSLFTFFSFAYDFVPRRKLVRYTCILNPGS